MSSDFYKLAEELRTEIENAIKSELSRRSILERVGFSFFAPLKINVITDQGAVSLVILKDGAVQTSKHLPQNPDNIIETDFETLKNLYHSREKNQFLQAEKERRIKITSNNLKGQQAERKVRELLGH